MKGPWIDTVTFSPVTGSMVEKAQVAKSTANALWLWAGTGEQVLITYDQLMALAKWCQDD